MSFSKSKRLPSLQSCCTGNLSAGRSTRSTSRPGSAGSARTARSDTSGAVRVTSRQPQRQELTQPQAFHVWNRLEEKSFVQWEDRWCTRVAETEAAGPSCSLPIALVEVLQGIWRDALARGRRFVCIIETCHDCEDHRRTTKHKPEKYRAYAAQVTDLIAKEFSFMAVEQMHLSRHYWAKRVVRRLGAFEVYILAPDGPLNDKACVISLAHSKLTSLNWPNLGLLKTRLVSALPGIVRRILLLRSQNWNVTEGQMVMQEAKAWGLSQWDALDGLADQVSSANRVLEQGQSALERNDKEALREAISDCQELQLADDLIGGWMDELKQKNMALFSIKLHAKRFQRNAAFAAASRQLVGAQQRPLRKAKLEAAILKAQKAEVPEEEILPAAHLQSRVEDAIYRITSAMEQQTLLEMACGIDEAQELGVQDEALSKAQSLLTSFGQRAQRASEQRDLVELEWILGAWKIDDVGTGEGSATASGPEYQAVLQAEKVRGSLTKQVEEAERRFEAKRWDALKSAMERLQDAHIQEDIWDRWASAIRTEKHWSILHAVSGAALQLKRRLHTRRLEAVLQAEKVSLTQLDEAADAAEAGQVDKDLVAKARAEASTARQRWKDAKEAMDKKLVDRADVMVWKLKKGRVCVDELVNRQGLLWDLVDAIQDAEASKDWQAMRDAVAGWTEERPGIEHEAFKAPESATQLFRAAQKRQDELRLRELRQDVNDILNSLKDPMSSLSATEAKAELQRCAKLVREMLRLGWEMTPARNARLLLALGKVKAEGGREVSLARFNAALLQMLEGSPQVVLVLDTSGVKDMFEEELRAAALRMAEGIRRNTSGSACAVVTYSPVEVLSDLSSDFTQLRTLLAGLRCRAGKPQSAKALREAKQLLKLEKSEPQAPDRQQVILHLTAAPENTKDSQKALKVLDALQVSVLGLGIGSVKVEHLMKISSPGLAFKVDADELEDFLQDAFREVEEILKASHTGDPEEILRRLEGT